MASMHLSLIRVKAASVRPGTQVRVSAKQQFGCAARRRFAYLLSEVAFGNN